MALSSEHRARKRFGQNFLVDQGIIDKIVRSIHPSKDDTLVEIGPGQGALTEPLLSSCPDLNVVEIDRDLVKLLEQQFSSHTGLIIHQADALKFDFSSLADDEKKLRIVGNLPYNISTPLIFHLLSFGPLIQDMHFMLQKEVVERMGAKENSRDFGRLSIMCQYHCLVEPLFLVPRHAFSPAPKVESAIVRLTPRENPITRANDLQLFDKVVRTAFQQRRKTLRNTLKPLIEQSDLLQQLNINPQDRPENIPLRDYVRISNALGDS